MNYRRRAAIFSILCCMLFCTTIHAASSTLLKRAEEILGKAVKSGVKVPIGAGEKLEDLLKNHQKAARGYVKMLEIAKKLNTQGEKAGNLLARLTLALRRVNDGLGDPNQFRKFLEDFDDLHDHVKNSLGPANLKKLEETVANMATSFNKPGLSRGYAYELHLLSRFKNQIKAVQPTILGNFRDILLSADNFVEAKFWLKTTVAQGSKRLSASIDSHFKRLFKSGVTDIDDLTEIAFYFNKRADAQWISRLKTRAAQAIKKYYQVSYVEAKAKAEELIEIVVDDWGTNW